MGQDLRDLTRPSVNRETSIPDFQVPSRRGFELGMYNLYVGFSPAEHIVGHLRKEVKDTFGNSSKVY